MSGTGHFDEITCMLYLDGQLEGARADELAAHAEACGECRALLVALESESRLLEHAMLEEEEAVPARLLGPAAAEQVTPWTWIAAMGMAAAGVYYLFAEWVNPWTDQFSQAGFGQGTFMTMLLFGGAFWEGWREMLQLIETVAAISLIGGTAYLLRHRLRRIHITHAAMLASLGALLAMPQPAGAAELRRSETGVSVKSGETIKNDLIVITRIGNIDGTVEGDLIFCGQSLTVRGHVTGDVISFGQRTAIKGQVDGNVRSFAEGLEITGKVGKNVITFVKTLDLGRESVVGGSLTTFVANASLDGRVGRDLLMYVDALQLNGPVGGGALIKGRTLTVGPDAEMAGKAKFIGRKPPQVDGAAKLASPIEFEKAEEKSDYTSPRYYWHQALKLGAGFVFGMIWILLTPQFHTEVQRSAKRYGPALGVGLLTLVATPIIGAIVCITLVGLSAGISALLFYGMAVYAAHVIVASWIGNLMLGEGSGAGAALGRLALGLLVIRAVDHIPYVGGFLFWLAVLSLGLGALVLAIAGRLKATPAAPGAVVEAMA